MRYRAWNINGAGQWSNSGYILAANKPSRPAIPAYVESDETSVTLAFSQSDDDGGLIIQEYELQISEFSETNW